MAAEVFYHSVRGEDLGQFGGDMLHNKDYYSVDDYGDGQGNETFVVEFEGKVRVFDGEITGHSMNEDGEVGADLSVFKIHAVLEPGQQHCQFIYDTEQNKKILFVRNLGETSVKPLRVLGITPSPQ